MRKWGWAWSQWEGVTRTFCGQLWNHMYVTELERVGECHRLGKGNNGIIERVHWKCNASFPLPAVQVYLLPEPLLSSVMPANLPLRVTPLASWLCYRINSGTGFQPTCTLTSSLLVTSTPTLQSSCFADSLSFCLWWFTWLVLLPLRLHCHECYHLITGA